MRISLKEAIDKLEEELAKLKELEKELNELDECHCNEDEKIVHEYLKYKDVDGC